jgi:hypothetical protein
MGELGKGKPETHQMRSPKRGGLATGRETDESGTADGFEDMAVQAAFPPGK